MTDGGHQSQGDGPQTHVYNGFKEIIEARVTVNIDNATAERLGKLGVAAMKLSDKLECGKTVNQFFQQCGYTKIAPGEYLNFVIGGPDGRVYLSVRTGSEMIAENFPLVNNYSAIVDAKGLLRQAKMGDIWIDQQGINRKIKN